MGNQVTRSIIVEGDLSYLYELWSNFENFPHFMKNITSVTKGGNGTSHWVMEGPLNTRLEWDAETTRMEENKRVAWSTKGDDGDVTTSGQVTFNGLPDNQVQITVILHYEPNKGRLVGEVVNALFANPEEMLEEDLRNFKAFAEARF